MHSIEIEPTDDGIYVIMNNGEACVFLSFDQGEELIKELQSIYGELND